MSANTHTHTWQMYYTNVHDYVKLLPRTEGTNCIIPITNVRIKCGFLRHSIVVVVVVATCFRIAVEYAWIVAKIKYVPTYIFVCLEPTRQPHWRICTPVGLKDWLVVCSFAWSIVHTSRHRQTYLYICVSKCLLLGWPQQPGDTYEWKWMDGGGWQGVDRSI